MNVISQAGNDNFDVVIMVTVFASYGVARSRCHHIATISGNLWEHHISCQYLISHSYRFAYAHIIEVLTISSLLFIKFDQQ